MPDTKKPATPEVMAALWRCQRCRRDVELPASVPAEEVMTLHRLVCRPGVLAPRRPVLA